MPDPANHASLLQNAMRNAIPSDRERYAALEMTAAASYNQLERDRMAHQLDVEREQTRRTAIVAKTVLTCVMIIGLMLFAIALVKPAGQ